MFRKPKSKAVQRQRVSNWDENEEVAEDQKEAAGTQPVVKAAFQREEEEEDPPVSTKPPSLLSFDDDEGASHCVFESCKFSLPVVGECFSLILFYLFYCKKVGF